MLRIKLTQTDFGEGGCYYVRIESPRFDGEIDVKAKAFTYGPHDGEMDRAEAFECAREYANGAKDALRHAGLRFDDCVGSPLRELRAIREAEAA